MAKFTFFLGKGGVGKSTVSALAALALAGQGKNVLLVSLDPAHNLSDIFGIKFGDRPKKIITHLMGMEIDEKARVKKYLHGIETRLRNTFHYHTAFNLGRYFDIIKFSPGIEEYSLMQAFMDIRDRFNNKDIILVDLPPTALTLKFLRLPSLSMLWLNKLKELRETIIKKKEIVTRIKFGGKTIERDKILNGIEELLTEYHTINGILTSTTDSALYIVMNSDILSQSESGMIHGELEKIGLGVHGIIINKVLSDISREKPIHHFHSIAHHFLPHSDFPLVRTGNLNRYLTLHGDSTLFTELESFI